jgi:hypothetical protein
MTRNQIAIQLKKIATDHRQVRTAKVVNPDYFLHNEVKDVIYPAVFMTMGNSTTEGKIKTHTVQVTVADIVLHTTELEVQSDMEQVANDLVGQIGWEKQPWRFTRSTTFEFFEDKFEDIVAGVTFSIDLEVPFLYDVCDLPSNYELPDAGEFIIVENYLIKRTNKVADFIVSNSAPMQQDDTEYQNNLLTVPPLVFIDGLILTYQARNDRRYISHNATTKTITINGSVNEGENVQIYL